MRRNLIHQISEATNQKSERSTIRGAELELDRRQGRASNSNRYIVLLPTRSSAGSEFGRWSERFMVVTSRSYLSRALFLNRFWIAIQMTRRVSVCVVTPRKDQGLFGFS